jgi:hypothetical protein
MMKPSKLQVLVFLLGVAAGAVFTMFLQGACSCPHVVVHSSPRDTSGFLQGQALNTGTSNIPNAQCLDIDAIDSPSLGQWEQGIAFELHHHSTWVAGRSPR